MTDKHFAIVGGGIGGLTLAIALQKKGFSVTVYEKAPAIKPLGAGLVLAANAVNAFIDIGISDQILQAGKILRYLRIKSPDGRTLTETNAEKLSQKFGIINNFTIHRADLHRVLLGQLQDGTVKLNKACIDFGQDAEGVTLSFQDGTTDRVRYLVACDGIHSSIRKKLLPNSYPRYAGYTCWRGITDNIPVGLDMDETSETWGAEGRFGIAPLSNNRVYWFACVNAKENDVRMRNMKIKGIHRHFKDFHFPVSELIANTSDESLIWNDIIDIRPIKKFAFGNVVLLGDAAHATTPNMGQGACMAIEDAAILANCIENYATTEEAFTSFEAKRIKRTTKIVNNSWTIGKVAQLENRMMIQLRNLFMRATPVSVMERQVKFITQVSFN